MRVSREATTCIDKSSRCVAMSPMRVNPIRSALRRRPVVRSLHGIGAVLVMQPQQVHIVNRVPAIRIQVDPTRVPERVWLDVAAKLRVVVAVAVVVKAELGIEVVTGPAEAILDGIAMPIVGQRLDGNGSIRVRMVGSPDGVATGILDANRQAAGISEGVVRLA